MSKKRWLIVPLCAVLCSQGLFAQTLDRRVLGIDEMFRLADENSQSIQTYKTGKEAADEALKAAKSQRLPDIGASLSFSYLHTRVTELHFPFLVISNSAPATAQSPSAVLKYSVRSPRNMAMDCSTRTPSTDTIGPVMPISVI